MTGALIDANLLCLLVVGRIDRSAISSHPRLKAFDANDFGLLGAVIDRVGEPILCPHVLTEASNLLAFRQSTTQIVRWLASLADLVGRFAEHSEAATTAIGDRAYLRLGLTDAMLLVLAADQALTLVSDDLALCLEAARRGATTINYNNIRDGALRLADI